jgi:hypothetical protein
LLDQENEGQIDLWSCNTEKSAVTASTKEAKAWRMDMMKQANNKE